MRLFLRATDACKHCFFNLRINQFPNGSKLLLEDVPARLTRQPTRKETGNHHPKEKENKKKKQGKISLLPAENTAQQRIGTEKKRRPRGRKIVQRERGGERGCHREGRGREGERITCSMFDLNVLHHFVALKRDCVLLPLPFVCTLPHQKRPVARNILHSRKKKTQGRRVGWAIVSTCANATRPMPSRSHREQCCCCLLHCSATSIHHLPQQGWKAKYIARNRVAENGTRRAARAVRRG